MTRIPPQHAREFLLAGNCTHTLANRATGTRYTYRWVRRRDGGRDGEYRTVRGVYTGYWVSLLTGPDNTEWGDYTTIGRLQLDPDGTRLRPADRPLADDYATASPPVRGALWLLARVNDPSLPWGDDVELYHCGRCSRCGRTLTVPESLERGLGPECVRRT